ncbi:uncharacterized protein LOC142349195 [Convolutriloba macropyga]|uniref:uncharacterized protein LOC142349195 n=1 Tax=Convolutriloba macropyga TaxID=536237 RepID=UPI003F5211E2
MRQVTLLALTLYFLGIGTHSFEVSPSTIATVPFGVGHISVYEHSGIQGRYYAMPLAYLLNNTATPSQNFLTGQSEMSFDVLLWSLEAREAVYRHLRANFDSQVATEEIEVMPMDKIRLVWRSNVRSLTNDLKIDDSWKSSNSRSSIATFHFTCSTLVVCEQLATYMENNSDKFDALELEFVISGQNSFRRDLKISASNIKSGNFWAKLTNMHNTAAVRYLKSADMNLLLSETRQNIFGSLITEQGYVETGSEVKLREAIENILEKTEVEVSDFEDIQWESVFWEPSWARPDKLTSFLNHVITKEAQNSSNFEVTGTEKPGSFELGIPKFLGFFGIKTSVSRSESRTVSKKDFLSKLHEINSNIEWTGEMFTVKPMKLFRINLSLLNSTTNLSTENVQIEVLKSIHSMPIRVNDRLPQQNATFTHTLVMQRLEDKINSLKSDLSLKLEDSFQNFSSDVNLQVDSFMNDTESKLEPIEAKLESLPGWPAGSYCILKNGDCPPGFQHHSKAAYGLRTWGKYRTSGAGYFGSSAILQSSSESVAIITQTCCK